MSNFPEYILKDCKTALCLFAGEGENDVNYIQKAGIKKAFLLDQNADRHLLSKTKYPEYDSFLVDVFESFPKLTGDYDIITCDQYVSDDFKVWELYDKLKARAKKYLVISVCQKSIDEGLKLPEGELFNRHSGWLGGVYWHITKIQ